MTRSNVLAIVALVVVWGSYLALQEYPIAKHFQPSPIAATVAMMSFPAAGSTQAAGTDHCTTCLAEPSKARDLLLLVGNPFVMSVDASAGIEAQLFYHDTIARPRLLRDSVGIRLVGAESALAVQPSEARYTRVDTKMGPWEWIVTAQRAGSYYLMVEFVRLPSDLEELLHRPDTAAVRRQRRVWMANRTTLHRSTRIPLLVLTSAGWTAEQQARMTMIGAGLTFIIGFLKLLDWLLKKESGRNMTHAP